MGTSTITTLTFCLLLVLIPASHVRSEEDLVILNPEKPSIQYDTSNVLLPGDTIFIEAKGENQLSATVQISEEGRSYLPFLRRANLIFGYLTISEAIAQVKSSLKEEVGDYVVSMKKLVRAGGTQTESHEE
jgi:hypothetical protein